MKGIVFTELMELVEDAQSPAFLQEAINEADLPSGGAYTSVGTYPVCEMGALVQALSQKMSVPVTDLMKTFGKHLFGRFAHIYPQFFADSSDAFSFLASIEDHIHKEVLKLYPDAELPSFEVTEHSANRFVMIYNSSRHLGDVCEGLIVGCLEYFAEPASVTRKVLADDAVSRIEFTIVKN
ncbi:heme NO-binding domain-containing protein [Parvularcula sp. IMCC14364]|uniref:heme NO-binding domain-containing protein n=1 Tax=Parvularcula sp. IMCC14364 TaxID=3067902 RepID=UPI0027426721|nr:heme NO-binding domain-containing protein [Parvularcula sp. IMCC14364]